jgi:hypothetical protein
MMALFNWNLENLIQFSVYYNLFEESEGKKDPLSVTTSSKTNFLNSTIRKLLV